MARRCPHFVTGDFQPSHKFLPDDEYGRALDAIVKATSDVMVTADGGKRIFLGRRIVHPQPDWWFLGGRARPGETPQQAAARNVKREIGLQRPAESFQVVTHFSMVWQMRVQPPAENGTADITTIHRLEVRPEELDGVVLDEKEYSECRWFDAATIRTGDFHPVLKQSVRDMEAQILFQDLQRLVESGASEEQVAKAARGLVQASKLEPVLEDSDSAVKVHIGDGKYSVTPLSAIASS